MLDPAPPAKADRRSACSGLSIGCGLSFTCALQLARALNYRSLGTVEFLLDRENQYYFIEVNPRIQVEHPVTEMVTGIDLVTAQLHLAAGGGLPYSQEQIRTRGGRLRRACWLKIRQKGFYRRRVKSVT
jgi:biotin carboxylase